MKKILFLMSHIGSGSQHLFDILSANPAIDGFRSEIVYDHPEALGDLLEEPHKNDNSAAIYMDELLHNFRLTCKPLCRLCKFIYVIGEPKPSINRIHAAGYALDAAVRYYCFRLRGMYEYFRRSGGLFCCLQPHELDRIEKYLELRTPLVWKPYVERYEEFVPYDAIRECEECYERYLAHWRNCS